MSDNEFECRAATELRATDEGRITGYAAVFNASSHDLGGFIETIAPGAFSRTLRENPDVLALYEHDAHRVLGRTTNGTLVLTEDEHGLRFDLTPADTSYARDMLALVRRGDIGGASFRFRPYPGGSAMDVTQTPALRTLRAVELKEISIVLDPAYPSAGVVSVRALDAARDEYGRHLTRGRRLRLAELTK